MTDNTNRRSFLKYWGAGTAAVALAGCLGGDGDDDDETGDTNEAGGDDDTGGDDDDTGDAEGWEPEQDVEYIIPFSEGGGTDTWARGGMVESMSEIAGQEVLINNIPGSDSMRGCAELVHSDTDGHTIGAFNPPSSPTTFLIHEPDLDWDLRDVEGIAGYSYTVSVYYVNADLAEEHDIDGPEDLERAFQEGQISSHGARPRGSYYHARAEILKDIGFEHNEYVGYEGSGPTVQAIASGEVDAGQASDTAGEALVEDGLIKPVMALYSEGSPLYPDVTPISETHENIDFIGRSIRGIWAPPGTDDEITEYWEGVVEEALETDRVQDWAEESDNPLNFVGREEIHDTLLDLMETIEERVDLEALREDAGELD